MTREHAETYDIILIDAFSQWGPADVNHDKPFILNCQSLLNNQGIIGFSLWNRKEDQFHTIHRRMCSLFNENLLSLSLGKRDSNVVLFGFKNDYPLKNIRAAEMRAARLLLDWGINFPNYMKLIQIQNLSLLKNIKKHFSVTL
ncbi:MAG TPA: hypothetical protein ENK06_09405 [Gammaproteobacteria bacterium]|nr:hypothetical protein [Gammaproteobacteria bacterium]